MVHSHTHGCTHGEWVHLLQEESRPHAANMTDNEAVVSAKARQKYPRLSCSRDHATRQGFPSGCEATNRLQTPKPRKIKMREK